MLTTSSATVHSVKLIQHGSPITAGEHHVEVDVVEDSTGLLTIYIRQLHGDQDPVSIKMVGPQEVVV